MPAWRIYVFGLVLVAMVVCFGYLRLNRLSKAPAPPVAIERTEVSDATMLQQVNPVFYGDARNGDVVLRYEDRLDLYRPSEDRVIKSAPIAK